MEMGIGRGTFNQPSPFPGFGGYFVHPLKKEMNLILLLHFLGIVADTDEGIREQFVRLHLSY